MLVFNQAVLAWRAKGGQLVRGWPFGPVNMPFSGDTCLAHTLFCPYFDQALPGEQGEQGVSGSDDDGSALRSATCDVRRLLLAMQTSGQFAFAHKLGCGYKLQC